MGSKRKPRRNASGGGVDVVLDTLSKPRFWNAPNSVSIARLALVLYALFSCVARDDHRILWLDPSFQQERLEQDQHLAWIYGRYLFVIMTACGAALDGLDGKFLGFKTPRFL
jgi:phosphatidylglycerophosphate synthase